MGLREDCQGRAVFITGGASGIGLAIGKLFSAMGAHICSFSIDSEETRTLAEKLFGENAISDTQRFSARELNVTDRAAVSAAMEAAIADFGAPVVLINSAGRGGAVLFEQDSFERFESFFQLNVFATRHVIEACLPVMKEAGNGYIVNVSSMAGLIGNYGYTAYSGSKFAVVGFTQALRSELRPFGIRVSVLCPVQVDTPMIRETDAYKPPETKAINDKAGIMSADEVAVGMVAGMERGRFIIVPGFKGTMVLKLDRFFPNFRERMTERIMAKARAKKAGSSDG